MKLVYTVFYEKTKEIFLMYRFFSRENKRITLTRLSDILLIIMASAFITLLAIYIAPESFMAFLGLIKESPLLFVLNMLPVVILSLMVYLIANSSVLSVFVSGIVFIVFAVSNTIKISMRQDPVLPTDLTIIAEVTAIVKNFNASDIIMTAAILIAVIVIAVILFIFVKSEKTTFKMRSGLICGLIVLCASLNSHLYADTELYDSFTVIGNRYFTVNQYGSKGAIYSFIHNLNTMKVSEPEGYDDYSFPSVYTYMYNEQNAKNRPNIIMIMGEAFSDMSENPNISFEGYTDPLHNFRTLCADEGAISGRLVVPNFGGGTSDTEFDVLTGYPTKYIGSTLPSYSFVNSRTDGLPWILKNMGYDTLAVHPGYSWFYNRLNVYKHLGFDEFIHLDDFDPITQNKGGYISEEACMDKVIEKIDAHSSDEDPLFMFCVTIENHGPYDEKYNEKYDNFTTDIPLTELEDTLLNSYFEGIKDADRELKRLTDHIKDSAEPYIIIYFGDHLPGFSNGTAFFDILDYNINMNGTTEQRLGVYETPLLIWQNDAAKESMAIDTNDVIMPANMTINANYLGALLLQYMGYGDATEYMAYINELRTTLPVAANSCYMDINGNYYDDIDEASKQKVAHLKAYVYKQMFDKE